MNDGDSTEARRHRVRRSLVVGLLAALVVGLSLPAPVSSILDEFLPIMAAQRILAGEVPYRDFFTLYPPLVPLLDAAVLAIAPFSIIATRLLLVPVIVAGVLVAMEAASTLAEDERAGTVVGLVCVAGHVDPLWGYPLVYATVLVLGAFLACLRATSARGLALGGALLGLGALARHDAAAYVALPIVAVLLARTGRLRPVAIVLGVAAAIVASAALALIACGAGPAAYHHLFRIPATIYPRARSVPWPPLDLVTTTGIYLPLALAAAALVRTAIDPAPERRTQVVLLAAAAAPLLLAIAAKVRTDYWHFYPLRLASSMSLALLLRPSASASRRRMFLLLAGLLAGPGVVHDVVDAFGRGSRLVHAELVASGPRRGLIDDEAPARRHTLDLVAGRPEGSRIYVGLRSHERILVNDLGLYVDARALPATRYHELCPLVADTEAGQAAIVEDLERWRPTIVVLANALHSAEPNESSRPTGVYTLGAYLERTYEPVGAEGSYLVLRRRR